MEKCCIMTETDHGLLLFHFLPEQRRMRQSWDSDPEDTPYLLMPADGQKPSELWRMRRICFPLLKIRIFRHMMPPIRCTGGIFKTNGTIIASHVSGVEQ